MSLGEHMFMDFMKHLYDLWLETEDKASYTCELPSLGHTKLHELCKYRAPDKLLEFLASFNGSVDVVDPDSGATPLVTACKTGNLDAVRILIERGANVNHGCSGVCNARMKYSNVTPIYVAAAEGHYQIVEYLGTHGADVNATMSPINLTPVHRAVLGKHEKVVAVLVRQFNAKVSIPSIDSPCSHPLHSAIVIGDHEILTILLEADDVDPNVADATEHVTPLHFGAYKGDCKAVEILLGRGVNANAQLKSGHSPLDLAVQEKNRHVAESLRAYSGRRKIMDKTWHPMICCVNNGLHSVKVALNRGADINSMISPKIGTALHFFVSSRKMDACKFLIKNGANLESKDVLGRTPLLVATERGYVHFMEFLIDKGADVNCRTDTGLTPLHRAAIEGDYAACKLLIKKGADIEAMATELGPPIMGAIHQSHEEVVKLLLESGANPNATNLERSAESVTVLQIAVQFAGRKPEILKALVDAGADVRAPIITKQGVLSYLHILPLVTDKVESLKILIEAGAYLDSQAVQKKNYPNAKYCIHIKGQHGSNCMAVRYYGSPLHASRSGGYPQLTRLLEVTLSLFKSVCKNDMTAVKKFLDQGGLVNCCSVRFDTPLIYASWKGYTDMVKFLLANGANIDMPNVQNSSPLHYAAKYNQKDVAVLLIKAGAPLNQVKNSKTPLELAKENNCDDIVAILEFAKKYLESSRGKKFTPVPNWQSDPTITKLVSEFDGKIKENDLQALFDP